eukprot:CAMPEP_0175467700 /NCGR_PEP_ID=MMETSP0095-20121207/71447_1 /TAXON_ID=311494 /ORGANISM="Alexandrium monilatum, Strain CCMP3105" /LENGTH=127 /DNA_ID=CAMNT_0016769065 /DNA_START=269 /DNA_END=650 /DNA_ORIENTATION=+
MSLMFSHHWTEESGPRVFPLTSPNENFLVWQSLPQGTLAAAAGAAAAAVGGGAATAALPQKPQVRSQSPPARQSGQKSVAQALRAATACAPQLEEVPGELRLRIPHDADGRQEEQDLHEHDGQRQTP